MAYEYKCVSGPTIVAVKNTKVRDQAVKAFEDIMNAQAEHGWEFVGIDEFHVSEPQGILSRKRVYVPAKILVFRREKTGSLLADALRARGIKAENTLPISDLISENPSSTPVLMQQVEETKKMSLQSIVERIKRRAG